MSLAIGGGTMQYINLDQQGFYKPFEALRSARDTGLGLYKDFREGGNLDAQKAQTQQQQNAASTGTAAYGTERATAAPLAGATAGAPGAPAAQPSPNPAGPGAPTQWPTNGDPAKDWHPDNLSDAGRTVASNVFANPGDIARYKAAKASGATEQQALAQGDNGIGFTGMNTAVTPSVAFNRNILTGHYGSPEAAAGKLVDVTINGVTQRLPVGDVHGTKGVANGVGIDLSHPATQMFPGYQSGAQTTYKFVDPPAAGSRAALHASGGQPAAPGADAAAGDAQLAAWKAAHPDGKMGVHGTDVPTGPAVQQAIAQAGGQPAAAPAAAPPTALPQLPMLANITKPAPGAPAAAQPPPGGRPNPSGLVENSSPEVQAAIAAKSQARGYGPAFNKQLLAAGDPTAVLASAPPTSGPSTNVGDIGGPGAPPRVPNSPLALPPVNDNIAPDGGQIRKAVAAPAAAQAPQAPAVTPEALTQATGVPATSPSGQTNFWSTLQPQQQAQIVQQHGQAAYDMAIASGANPRQAAAARAAATPQLTAQKWDAIVGQTSNVRRLPQIVDPSGQPTINTQGTAKGSDGTESQFISQPGFDQAHPGLRIEAAKANNEFQKTADADMQETLKSNPVASQYIGDQTRPGLARVQNELTAIMQGNGRYYDPSGKTPVTPQQMKTLNPQEAAQLVFRYEKTNDAGAIVRPEMFHTIAQRAGMLDQMKAKFGAAVSSGNAIPAKVSADLVNTIQNQTTASRAEFIKEMKRVDPMMKQKWGSQYGGVDKSGVIPASDKDEIMGRAQAAAPGAPAAGRVQSFANPKIAEAQIKALGLAPGTKIMIGGRPATVGGQ